MFLEFPKISNMIRLIQLLIGCVITYGAFVYDGGIASVILQIICGFFLFLAIIGTCVDDLDTTFRSENILTFLIWIPPTAFTYWCYFFHDHAFYGCIVVLLHIVFHIRLITYKLTQ
jgi:hypothetical protein